MNEQLLTEMNYTEFQQLLDAYITRSAQRDDAIPAPTFLNLLFDLLAKRASNIVQLEGQVVDGQLYLLPVETTAHVQVQRNRVLLDDWQFVITLKDAAFQPA